MEKNKEQNKEQEFIVNLAKEQLKKLETDTVEQLNAMDENQISEVLTTAVMEELKLNNELSRIGNRYDELEIMLTYLNKVYQDKYGIDIYQIEIVPEDDGFENET